MVRVSRCEAWQIERSRPGRIDAGQKSGDAALPRPAYPGHAGVASSERGSPAAQQRRHLRHADSWPTVQYIGTYADTLQQAVAKVQAAVPLAIVA